MPSDKELEKEAKKIFDEFERDLREYIEKRQKKERIHRNIKKTKNFKKNATG